MALSEFQRVPRKVSPKKPLTIRVPEKPDPLFIDTLFGTTGTLTVQARASDPIGAIKMDRQRTERFGSLSIYGRTMMSQTQATTTVRPEAHKFARQTCHSFTRS